MVLDAETADPTWRGLYRVGGATALISAVFGPFKVTFFAVWG